MSWFNYKFIMTFSALSAPPRETYSCTGLGRNLPMPILFKNCAVLDTERGGLLPGHEVLVEGAIIREVSGRPIQAPDATVFDLGGRTLMPGLCDAHVHVTAIEADLTKLDRLSPSYITARSINVLSGMLRRGFTTVRDAAGADHGLAQAVRE